jgi:hypothetical protein
VRVAIVVTLLDDGFVGSKGSADVRGLTGLGTRGIADGGILETFGDVLAGRAALNTVVSFTVPYAAVVPNTGLLVVVSGFAAAFADTSEVPLTTSVGFAGSGVGVQDSVLALSEASTETSVGGGVPGALLVSGTLSLNVDDGADGLAHSSLILAGGVTKTFSDVVDQEALLVALVVERVEAARRIGIATGSRVVALIFAFTRAVHEGSRSSCVPGAHARGFASVVVETPAVRDAGELEDIVAASRVFGTVLARITRATERAVHLTGVVPEVALVIVQALLLHFWPVTHWAVLNAALEELIPHAIASVVSGLADSLVRSTRHALLAALSVGEVVAETFGSADITLVLFGTLGDTAEVDGIPLAFGISITLPLSDVFTTRAASAALGNTRRFSSVGVPAAEGVSIASDVVVDGDTLSTALFGDWIPRAGSSVHWVGAGRFRRIEVASLLAGTLAGGFEDDCARNLEGGLILDEDGEHEVLDDGGIDDEALTVRTSEGAREARPQDIVTDTVVEVAATTSGDVVLDGVDDVEPVGAAFADIAREDDEDDVEVTSNAGDELLVLVDLATVVGGHVEDSQVVEATEGQIVDLSFVGQPAASFFSDVGTLTRSLGFAHLGDTSGVGPVPFALLVEIAIELIGSSLIADVAGSVAVTSSRGSFFPVAAFISDTIRRVGPELALDVALRLSLVPLAGGVVDAVLLESVVNTLFAAALFNHEVVVALFVSLAHVDDIVLTHLLHAESTEVVPLAIDVAFADGEVVVIVTEDATKSAVVIGGLVLADVAEIRIRTVDGSVVSVPRAVHCAVILSVRPLVPQATSIVHASRGVVVSRHTTLLAALGGSRRDGHESVVVAVLAVVIVDAESIRGIGLALTFAASVGGIPLATQCITIAGGIQAIISNRVGFLAANVAGGVVPGSRKTLRLPVALGVSKASRFVGEGAAFGLALSTEELAKLLVGDWVTNIEAISLAKSPGAPVLLASSLFVVPEASNITFARSGCGISALDALATLGGVVPLAVGIFGDSGRHAFGGIVRARKFFAVGVSISAISILIPLAARISSANGSVVEDAAIDDALAVDFVPEAGRILLAGESVTSADLAVA